MTSSATPARLNQVLGAVVLGALALSAAGQETEAPVLNGDLTALLAHADVHSPMIASSAMETEAARLRTKSAGAWADPMLRIEPEDILNDGLELSPARVGRTRYQLMQDLPWQGKRGLRRAIAEAGSDQALAVQDRVRSEVHRAIRVAQAQWLESEGRLGVLGDIDALIADLETVARARYGTGLAPQGDVFRAQLELTRLAAERAELQGRAQAARARLNALLGRATDARLAMPSSQDLEPLPDLAGALARAVNDAPEVRTADALQQAAGHQRELTLRERWPDFKVGVMAMQSGTTVDEWGLMVEFNLPLRQARRRAEEGERAAMLDAARLAREDVYVRALGGLRESHAEAQAALERWALARETLEPQAGLTLEAALGAYRTGAMDFLSLIDAALQIKQARLDSVAAAADFRRSLAEFLDYLGEA